jgi:hypothetical protein
MAEFMVDIKGKINNTSLPDSKYLWAVLESIVNSIQSIEEAGIRGGHIEVYAQRANAEQLKWEIMNASADGEFIKPEISEFDSFSISDNIRLKQGLSTLFPL